MKKSQIKSLLTFLIGWPLSLFALYFIFTRVFTERENLFANLHTLNVAPLLIGLAFFILYFYLRAAIWYLLLRSFSYELSYKESTGLWSVTQLKRYIPGNIWSFLGLTLLLNKKGIEKKHTLQAILFEQQLVIVSGFLIALLGMPFFLTHFLPTNIPLLKEGIYALVILVGLLFIFNRLILAKLTLPFKKHLENITPGYPVKRQWELVGMMAISFFVLGAGYYFVLLSISFVTPALFLQIIGISVFSLLIGFLSFITPTGLGVREGVFAFILSKIMTFSIAGFAALLARILLIVAELIFVLFATLVNKIQFHKLKRVESAILRHPQMTLILIGIFIFTTYFSYAGFLRYDNFYTGRFDLGNMAQTVWNTTRGHIFMFTDPNGTREVSRLAFHADFLLILLAPFYMLWSNPKMLILIQAFVVALGSIFVFLLGKKLLNNKNIALTLAFIYLLNPSIQWTLLYDFHAVVLATTFLLGCWYFIINKQYRYFIVFAVLAGISKEQVWFVIALMGLYISIFQRKLQIGFTIFLGSVAIFYLLLWQIIPNASGSLSHFALAYYKDGGENPSALIKNTIAKPLDTIQKVTNEKRMLYMRQLFEPLGYLSLLSPMYLVFAGTDMGINLLSDKPQLHQIYYQYSAVITPFLFIASIYGILILKRLFPKIPYWALSSYLIIMTLSAAYQYGPLPGSKQQNIGMFTRSQPNKEEITKILFTLPSDTSVAATNNLGPQLSHRREIFVVPFGTESADMVAFLFTERSFTKKNSDAQLYNALLQNPEYKKIQEIGLFTLFERQN